MSSKTPEQPRLEPVPTTAAPAANEPAAAAPSHSGLRALASVARHMGLDWSLTRLLHLYGKDKELEPRDLVRIAKAEGMKAALHKSNWKEVSASQKLTPFLVRLNTGAWFVVVKVGDAARKEGEPEQVVL